jgi:hypothetical protein
MSESSAMLEIRKIRDKNSMRHLSMTPDELVKEFDEAAKRFIKRMNKDVEIVTLPAAQS